jgi:hypothetical protein
MTSNITVALESMEVSTAIDGGRVAVITVEPPATA